METIIDITKALPGERFRFRMIGQPKSWYRFYLEDGTYVDCEEDGENALSVFATFAIDRDRESLCVVIMHRELAVDLSGKFKTLGVRPNDVNGVDVDIDVTDRIKARYLIDIGRCSRLDNPDIIEKMNSVWDDFMEGIASFSTDKAEIEGMKTVPWNPPDWPRLPENIYDIDEISALIDNGDYKEILVSFLVETASDQSCDMAPTASKILKAIRIHG